MDLLLLGYVVIFALSAVACVAAIPRARDIQHRGTRDGFVVFLGSVALWSLGDPLNTVNAALANWLTKQDALAITQDDETRFYDVSSTPFTAGEVTTGRLMTVTDVTERESYRQQLEEKTGQLEALNRVVRHDIRNDMAVILGWAEILEDQVDDDGRDALERVLQKSRQVIQPTEVARDFVESLSTDGTTELEAIELRPLLDAELAAVRDSFPSAQFRVSGDIPDVTVQANEMLSSVFRNIFENAVRHNDREESGDHSYL